MEVNLPARSYFDRGLRSRQLVQPEGGEEKGSLVNEESQRQSCGVRTILKLHAPNVRMGTVEIQ